MKNLYIVKNITSGEVNSPMVYRKDAILGADTWSLIKTEKEEESERTGGASAGSVSRNPGVSPGGFIWRTRSGVSRRKAAG